MTTATANQIAGRRKAHNTRIWKKEILNSQRFIVEAESALRYYDLKLKDQLAEAKTKEDFYALFNEIKGSKRHSFVEILAEMIEYEFCRVFNGTEYRKYLPYDHTKAHIENEKSNLEQLLRDHGDCAK